MNKRFALWGGLLAAMIVVAVVMIRFADNDTTVNQAGPAETNQSASADIFTVRDRDWTKGNPDADVVVVKYSDFQCPACRFYAAMDDRLSQELGDDVLFVYRHFPLRSFEHSWLAARYSEAAGRQGHFWRMHDLIYINQQQWSRGDAETIFRQFADSIDLDMAQLDEDLEDPELRERIQSDYQDGQQVGVRAVPSLFINGEAIDNPNSLEEYREMIESRL